MWRTYLCRESEPSSLGSIGRLASSVPATTCIGTSSLGRGFYRSASLPLLARSGFCPFSPRKRVKINITFVERVNRVCVLAGIAGHGFGENNPPDDHADLFAFTDDGFASIFPHRVRLGEDGRFFTAAVICDQSFDERCFTNRFFAERCRFEHTGFVFARDEETGERSNIATFLFRFPFPF